MQFKKLMSVFCVCPLIDDDFCDKIVKMDPQLTLTMLWGKSSSIRGQTHKKLTTICFYNNKLKWSSGQGLVKRELCGKKCKKNWILFNLTESLSITFLALSLVNNKIQEISLVEKLTVWSHIGARNFYLSVLWLTIKISQTQSEKLTCYCKIPSYHCTSCQSEYCNNYGVAIIATFKWHANLTGRILLTISAILYSSIGVKAPPWCIYIYLIISIVNLSEQIRMLARRAAWCVVRGAWCVVRGAWCMTSVGEYFDWLKIPWTSNNVFKSCRVVRLQ